MEQTNKQITTYSCTIMTAACFCSSSIFYIDLMPRGCPSHVKSTRFSLKVFASKFNM